MTKEQEIEILMEDYCTRSEAEDHLKCGTIVFEESDLKKHCELYVKEWKFDEEEAESFRTMLNGGKLFADWGRSKRTVIHSISCIAYRIGGDENNSKTKN